MTAGMGYIGVKTGLFRAMGGKAEMRAEDIARETKLVARPGPSPARPSSGQREFAETDGLESPTSLQTSQLTVLALRCRIARNWISR